MPASADPGLQLKWTKNLGNRGRTHVAPLAADLFGDGNMEVVLTGGDNSGTGALTTLNGTDGSIIWQVDNSLIGTHSPFDIADLDKNGIPEILVSAWYPYVYRGDSGSLYWNNQFCRAFQNYNAIVDVDGDGYLDIFVTGGSGPANSYDYITRLSYDGNIEAQTWIWHPCFGGLTVGDTNHDGRYELYVGDRSDGYSVDEDAYKAGGLGVAAFDALTLRPLWSEPTILISSATPMLADVDGDGIQDIVVGDQNTMINGGAAVLNSSDGSVLTTGGIYRKSETNIAIHSNPTVYDIDGDGHLEFINCKDTPVTIWDLYSWTQDAQLPVSCAEPPKLGDVTGDGKMDIVAVTQREIGNFTYSDIYIFSYISGAYQQVDHVTSPSPALMNNLSLIQDIDGDGKNELILTDLYGTVFCYDTLGVAPNPRARTNLQFYSESRLGVAEYVPPPKPAIPAFVEVQPSDGSLNQTINPALSVQAANSLGNPMNIIFETNASGSWLSIASYSGVSNGLYTASSPNMNGYRTKYYWNVTATDIVTGYSTEQTFSFMTASRPPMQSTPLLVSNSANLTCTNQTTIDPDGDKVANVYSWYVNDVPYTTLNLPFNERPNPAAEPLLFDGFENDFSNWNGNDATSWERTTGQKYSGSYSAHTNGALAGVLASDTLDTSMAEWIEVSFWYRETNLGLWDNVFLQFWNGSAYVDIINLGLTNPENAWHHYSISYRTFFNYRIPDFHIRFDTRSIGITDNLWIDDVSIQVLRTKTEDYSGCRNLAEVKGGSWTSQGVVGGARVFDGDDQLKLWDNSGTLGGNGAWSEVSVEFWFKVTQITNSEERLLWIHSPDSTSIIGYKVSLQINQTFFAVKWSVYNTPLMSTSIGSAWIVDGLSNWHHVTCTYKSGVGLKTYVDGTLKDSSGAVTGNIQDTNHGALEIAYQNGGQKDNPDFIGMLDEIRIYPRALSSAQVSIRYLETKNGVSNNASIATQETKVGELWKCLVTPNDSFEDGISKFSNALAIVNGTVNNPPIIDSYSPQNNPVILEGQQQAFSVVAHDPDGYPVTYKWYLDNVLVSTVNSYVFNAIIGSAGLHNVTVAVSDTIDQTTHEWTVNVMANNTPPTIDSYSPNYNPTILEGQQQAFSVVAHDPDGYPVTYKWYLDNSLVSTITSYTFDAAFTSSGTHNVTAVVSDGLDQVKHGWTLTVNNVNRPPTIDSFTPTNLSPQVNEGGSLQFSQTSSDPDGDPLTYSWLLDSVGKATSQNWTYFPTHADVGTHNVTLLVRDSAGLFVSKQWLVTVGVLFEDGFESGNFNAWTGISTSSGETAVAVNEAAYEGSFGAKFTSNGNGGSEAAYAYVNVLAVPEIHVRGSFKITQSGISDADDRFYFIKLKSNSNNDIAWAGWRKDYTGVIRWNLIIRDGTGWVIVYSTGISPTLNRWYNVELHWRFDTTSGIAELYVDGILVCSSYNKNTAALGDASRILFGLGEMVNCGATTLYADSCAVSKDYSQVTYTMSVSTIGQGLVSKNPDQVSYVSGTTVTLTAMPAVGWSFNSWSGALSGNTNPIIITMDSDKTVTANFIQNQYTLTVNVVGNGAVTKNPNSATYVYGENVTLAASPSAGYAFTSWSGDLTSTLNPVNITINGNEVVTASFMPVGVLFEDGFESGNFNAWTGTSVSLGENAVVNNTSAYVGAYGACFESNGDNSYEGVYTYTSLSSESEVYVQGCFNVHQSGISDNDDRFYLIWLRSTNNDLAFAGWRRDYNGVVRWNLVIRDGTGWVVIYSSMSPTVNRWYTVELHWKGDATNGVGELYVDGILVCSSYNKNTAALGNISQMRFGLTQLVNCGTTSVYADNCIVSKQFSQVTHALTINYDGNGSVSKSPDQVSYVSGTTVTLTAMPAAGWSFAGWSGALNGNTNPAVITMDDDKVVTALFLQNQYLLSVNIAGNGTVAKNPNKATYAYGENVTLTAIPAAGYAFTGWTGDIASTLNPVNITINGNEVVTASFMPVGVLFEDGFESGNFNAWTGTSVSLGENAAITGGSAYDGNYSATFTSNGNSLSESAVSYVSLPSQSEVYVRGLFKITQSGINDADDRFYFIKLRTLSGEVAWAGWRKDYTGVIRWNLIIRDGTGWVIVYSNDSIPTPSTNVWYNIELHWRKGSTDGLGELYVNGVLVCSAYSKNTSTYGDINQIRLGLTELVSCGATTVYTDNCTISKNYI